MGKVVFDGGAGLKRVRRVVVRIDEGALAAVCAARETCWICEIIDCARRDRLVDCRECVDPAILREVIVIKTDAGTENGVWRRARSVCDAETRREGFAVVMRNAADQWDIHGLQG